MNNNQENNTVNALEPREDHAFKAAVWLYDIVEIAALAVIVGLLIFTFCARLCRVEGDSMNNTLSNGETLITTNFCYEPKQGDIVVFHLSNEHYQKPLVKRIIATEGQSVKIDLTDKKVYVDGVLLDEPDTFLEGGDYSSIYFASGSLTRDKQGHTVYFAEVPEGMLFVMGDNRNHSADSRSDMVGLVDERCVLGKAVVRLSPFTMID